MTSTCLKTALSHPQNDVTFPINVKFLHFGEKRKLFLLVLPAILCNFVGQKLCTDEKIVICYALRARFNGDASERGSP